MACLNPDVGT